MARHEPHLSSGRSRPGDRGGVREPVSDGEGRGAGRALRARLGASGRARVRSHHPAVRSRGPGAAARPRSARGLMEAIEHPPIFSLPGIPDHVTYTWIVMIILAGLAFVASRRMD